MPYWIHDNGETIGPMKAIDVLRRATPTTRVCDGENWFVLGEMTDCEAGPGPDSECEDPGRLVIRSAAS